MTPQQVIDLGQRAIQVILFLSAPVLLTGMVVGLAVSLFQAVTSIQEATLTFVPKLFALAGLALLLTPWLLRSLTEFTVAMIARMATLAH